jgi:glyoxylase-like metal-dependent hydrolase (beta-lactamase superfamily II)
VDSDITIEAIHTPGHINDHMSFMVKFGEKRDLIVGDIVLGTPSAVVDDLSVYLQTLRALSTRNIDTLLLPHSLAHEAEHVMVPAKPKLAAYIKYREDRLKQIMDALDGRQLSRAELYECLYGDKGLQGQLIIMANRNLDLQLGKLMTDGQIECGHDQLYRAKL